MNKKIDYFRWYFYTLLVINFLVFILFPQSSYLLKLIYPVLELSLLILVFISVSTIISIFSQKSISKESMGIDFKEWNLHQVKIHWIQRNQANAFVLAMPILPMKNLYFTQNIRQHLNEEEFQAVFAHEVGHLYLNHHEKRLALFGALPILFFLQLNFFTFVLSHLPISSLIISLFSGFFIIVLSGYTCVKILSHALQAQELEADEFAMKVALIEKKSLKNAIVKLTQPHQSPLFKTHPEIEVRLKNVA